MKLGLDAPIATPHLTAHEEELRRWFINMVICGPKVTTYKFALGKFLLDYSSKIDPEKIQDMILTQKAKTVKYGDLAKKFFDYYRPHVNKYHMKQHHGKNETLVTQCIKKLLKKENATKKDRDATIDQIKKDVFGGAGHEKYVIPAFQNIKHGRHIHLDKMFYDYDDVKIMIKPEALKFFNENHNILRPLVILCWAEYLQRYNPDADLTEFLSDNKLSTKGNIEKDILLLLERLVPDDLETSKSLRDYCKNVTPPKESIFLISSEQDSMSEMLDRTVEKPVSTSDLVRYSIPKNIQKRSNVSILGLEKKYHHVWNQVKTDDLVIFFDKKRFFAYAKVLSKQQNKRAAVALWDKPAKDSLVFLSRIDHISISLNVAMPLFINMNDVKNYRLQIQKADLGKEVALRKKFETICNAIRSLDDKFIPADAVVTEESQIVRVRKGQGEFRKNVLKNFDYKCALCGISDEDLLEAAHIVPFKDRLYRGRTSNGICLCAMHHTMFDRKYFTINKNYDVLSSSKKMSPSSRLFLRCDFIRKPRLDLDPQLLDMHLAKFEKAEIACT